MNFGTWASFCAVAAITLSAAAAPNVVLIMADDVGVEAFGSYGSEQYSTPTLDKLAAEGVRFTHAYSLPLCTPSRVAIMTGKSNVANYVDFGALTPGQYTFAHLFRDAGYTTSIAGKWQLQGSKHAQGTPAEDAGFDTYCLWNTEKTSSERYWNPSIERDGELVELADGDFSADVFADYLIDFMAANRERPFFVYYPMVLVHEPFVPTPESVDPSSENEQANFEDMMAYMDATVGRILSAIDRLGLSDNTVVIFTSDNGTHCHINSRLDGRVVTGAKAKTLNNGTHVPLLVRVPGQAGGRVVPDLVDFSDFLPTLAEVIGAELPKDDELVGQSFWPQALGQPGNPREWIYSYYFPRPYAKQFDDNERHWEVRFAQDQRFKLYDNGELFDLSADILESEPIGTETPGAAEARRKLTLALASFPEHGKLIEQRSFAAAGWIIAGLVVLGIASVAYYQARRTLSDDKAGTA